MEKIFEGIEFDHKIGQKLGWNDKLWVENARIFSLLDLLSYLNAYHANHKTHLALHASPPVGKKPTNFCRINFFT